MKYDRLPKPDFVNDPELTDKEKITCMTYYLKLVDECNSYIIVDDEYVEIQS